MSVSKAEWKTIEQEVKATAKAVLEIDEVKTSKKMVVVIITDNDDQAFQKIIKDFHVSDLEKIAFVRIKSSQKTPYKAMIFNNGKQVGKTVSLDAKGIKQFTILLNQIVK